MPLVLPAPPPLALDAEAISDDAVRLPVAAAPAPGESAIGRIPRLPGSTETGAGAFVDAVPEGADEGWDAEADGAGLSSPPLVDGDADCDGARGGTKGTGADEGCDRVGDARMLGRGTEGPPPIVIGEPGAV